MLNTVDYMAIMRKLYDLPKKDKKTDKGMKNRKN